MASELQTESPLLRAINGSKEALIEEFDALIASNDRGDIRRMIQLAAVLLRRGDLRLVQREEPVRQSDPQGEPRP